MECVTRSLPTCRLQYISLLSVKRTPQDSASMHQPSVLETSCFAPLHSPQLRTATSVVGRCAGLPPLTQLPLVLSALICILCANNVLISCLC